MLINDSPSNRPIDGITLHSPNLRVQFVASTNPLPQSSRPVQQLHVLTTQLSISSVYCLRIQTTSATSSILIHNTRLLPIVEIPYAKYLDCGADMFFEAAISHWLSNGKYRPRQSAEWLVRGNQ